MGVLTSVNKWENIHREYRILDQTNDRLTGVRDLSVNNLLRKTLEWLNSKYASLQMEIKRILKVIGGIGENVGNWDQIIDIFYEMKQMLDIKV